MRELRWNETDVVECLGVLGTLDEDTAAYNFRRDLEDVFLDLSICAYASHVLITLSKPASHNPVFTAEFFVADSLLYVNESKVSYLEFSDCIFAPYEAEIDLDNSSTARKVSLRIYMYPEFGIKIV